MSASSSLRKKVVPVPIFSMEIVAPAFGEYISKCVGLKELRSDAITRRMNAYSAVQGDKIGSALGREDCRFNFGSKSNIILSSKMDDLYSFSEVVRAEIVVPRALAFLDLFVEKSIVGLDVYFSGHLKQRAILSRGKFLYGISYRSDGDDCVFLPTQLDVVDGF
jgi:hypothetical protein